MGAVVIGVVSIGGKSRWNAGGTLGRVALNVFIPTSQHIQPLSLFNVLDVGRLRWAVGRLGGGETQYFDWSKKTMAVSLPFSC